jgi:hypothetical protein
MVAHSRAIQMQRTRRRPRQNWRRGPRLHRASRAACVRCSGMHEWLASQLCVRARHAAQTQTLCVRVCVLSRAEPECAPEHHELSMSVRRSSLTRGVDIFRRRRFEFSTLLQATNCSRSWREQGGGPPSPRCHDDDDGALGPNI